MPALQVEDSGRGSRRPNASWSSSPSIRSLGNEAEGSGLGLPIVAEIAAHHDARVS